MSLSHKQMLEELDNVVRDCDMTDWELDFIDSNLHRIRTGVSISTKVKEIIETLYTKYVG